ncbi:response regulator [Flavobacterium sp. AG291]|uniref:response regulator n=1 Tax=Flavobacterium sp. AG291 TaxID=2184000 RepID=UPI000E0A4EA7|nr:response regulator [Flavobacterium sp. AG291]RDI07054.1 response regulator receiver domain-containing protein [Flavobacterium sp. AG291]
MHTNSLLLIDDDIDDRDLFHSTVKEISPETDCKQFSKVADALFYLENTETLPRIIFYDLGTPLLNNIGFLNDIKKNQKLKNIPIYVYSTSFIIKLMESDLIGQVNGYLFKTTNFLEFEKALREIIKVQ